MMSEGLMKTSFQFEELLTTEQAAKLLGLKKGTLDHWRYAGGTGLKFRKIGRMVRYVHSDLLEYINGRTFAHTGEF